MSGTSPPVCKGSPRQICNPEEQCLEYQCQLMQSKREDPCVGTRETGCKRLSKRRLNFGLVYVTDPKKQKLDIGINFSCEQPEFKKIIDKLFQMVPATHVADMIDCGFRKVF